MAGSAARGHSLRTDREAERKGCGLRLRLGVIVLAHRSPRQLALLLACLRHPHVRQYLHLDLAAEFEAFREQLQAVGPAEVVLLPRLRSRWGGIEVVDATLAGLRQGLSDGCDYFLLLSGQDCPLWPVDEIVEFFQRTPGRSYLETFPLPDSRWRYDGRLRTDFYTYTVRGRRETCIPAGVPCDFNWRARALNTLLRARGALRPARRFPAYVRPFGGSQWWNLSRTAAQFVLDFTAKHPDYRTYHEHTLLPDELFFQSILMGTSFGSDHEIVNDSLRFMIWPAGVSHPRSLALSDVPAMMASNKPFARKLDQTEAPAVLDALRLAKRLVRQESQ